MRLKQEGVRKGVLDIFATEPVFSDHHEVLFHGLWVELKQPGNYPTEDQHQFIVDQRSRNYYASWCDAAEDALDLFTRYFAGE